MATLTLPPDYFRAAAERYKQNPTDRYEWLAWQVNKAAESLLQYQNELAGLAKEMGLIPNEKSNSGMGVAAILTAIPTGYTQVVGGIMLVASSFFAKAENERKVKRIEDLRLIAVRVANEANGVAGYYNKYRTELLLWQLVPLVLIIWILTR